MQRKYLQKLYTTGANELIKMLTSHYNLTITQEHAEGIIRNLIRLDSEIASNTLHRNKKHIADKLLDAYWTTTKLPDNEKSRHSAFYFAQYIKRRYFIVVVPKLIWLQRLYRFINKNILIKTFRKRQYNNNFKKACIMINKNKNEKFLDYLLTEWRTIKYSDKNITCRFKVIAKSKNDNSVEAVWIEEQKSGLFNKIKKRINGNFSFKNESDYYTFLNEARQDWQKIFGFEDISIKKRYKIVELN